MWTPIAGKPGQQRCTLHATEFAVGRVCPDPGCASHGAAGTREPSEAERTQERASAIGLPTLLEYERTLLAHGRYWSVQMQAEHAAAARDREVLDELVGALKRHGGAADRETRSVRRAAKATWDRIRDQRRLAVNAGEVARKFYREAAELATLRTEAAETEHLEQVVAGVDNAEAN